MPMYRVIRLTLCREIWLASFYIRCLWNVVNHLRVTILLYIIVSSWKLITKLLIVLVSENCLYNSSLPPLVYPSFRILAWKRWWHQLVNQWPKYFYVILIHLFLSVIVAQRKYKYNRNVCIPVGTLPKTGFGGCSSVKWVYNTSVFIGDEGVRW